MHIDDVKSILQKNITTLLDSDTPFSMRKLSMEINCSESYIQKVVEGKIVPSLQKLIDIANYFDVPLATLLTESPKDIVVNHKAELVKNEIDKLPENVLDSILTIINYSNKSNYD